jgi:hypothetical protein
VTIAPGGAVTGVRIELFDLYGIISGRVTDDLGEPMVDTLVGALRPHPWHVAAGGSPALVRYWKTTRTDDRGVYRLQVEPGVYLVHVAGSPVAARPTTGTTPVGPADGRPRLDRGGYSVQVVDPDEREAGRRPVAAPVVDDQGRLWVSMSAVQPSAPGGSVDRLISVEAGRVYAGHDIQRALSSGHRVSGMVVGPDGPTAGTEVRLAPTFIGTTPVLLDDPVATATTAGDGSFTLDGVPAGRYELRVFETELVAARPSSASPVVTGPGGSTVAAMGTRRATAPPPGNGSVLWAIDDLVVGDRDLDGVRVVATRGARVSGDVTFETDGTPPAASRLARLSVSLSAERLMPPGLIMRADGDGRFGTAEYPPGRYLLRATLSGWVLKAAMYRGRDLASEPFELDGRAIDGIEIVMTDRTATLTGRVSSADVPGSRPDATVLIFRTDYAVRRAHSAPPGRSKAVSVAEDGSFSAGDLLAGEFFVAAVSGGEPPDWPSADALDRLVPLATRIVLAPGETANLALSTRGIR